MDCINARTIRTNNIKIAVRNENQKESGHIIV